MRLETNDVMSIPASAACRVAAEYGLISHDPVILQESNNTVVWLRPHAIIAKSASGLIVAKRSSENTL